MDVCAKLRGILQERRIGHGGTLDPMATGVLPVFVGQATRAVEFAENGEKEYVAGLRLGIVTNTQDVTGEVLETHPVQVSREDVVMVLSRFLGPQEQIPPMYSAVKIGGKKLYELARKGQEVAGSPGTSPSGSWNFWTRPVRRTFFCAAAVPRERISAPSVMILVKHWAAAAPWLPCAAPWPRVLPWRTPSPWRMCKRREKPCCFPPTVCLQTLLFCC